MRKRKKDPKESKRILRRLLKDFPKHKKWLVIASFMIFAEIIVNIYFAKILGNISDIAIEGSLKLLFDQFKIGFLICICQMITKYIKSYSSGRFSEYTVFDIRKKFIKHIGRLQFSVLDKNESGEILSRMANDINVIQFFLKNKLVEFWAVPLRVLGFSIILFNINWKLALFTYTIIPLMMGVILLISKPIEKYNNGEQKYISRANSISQQCIKGIEIIKSFNIQDKMKSKYKRNVDKSIKLGIRASVIQAITNPLSILMQYSPFLFTLSYGGYLGVKGEISYGTLLAFMQILVYSLGNLSNISNIVAQFRNASAASRRLYEILDSKIEDINGEISEKFEESKVVEFDNVSFSYDDGEQVFENLSFTLNKGETVALVGTSGCGKSTIMKMIMGFYQTDIGKIKIYGHDINMWNLDDMRELIAYVGQEPYLFPESIYDNIACGACDLNKEHIIMAAKLANIHEFIEGLADGYDTEVGEHGATLSGGQRQRVSIARAILKKSPILLLDEATAALDSGSEKAVQKSIEHLSKGRSVLVIAHRLSTIKNADRIIVMKSGKIIQIGNHRELIRKAGLYRELCEQQFGEVKEEILEPIGGMEYAG